MAARDILQESPANTCFFFNKFYNLIVVDTTDYKIAALKHKSSDKGYIHTLPYRRP